MATPQTIDLFATKGMEYLLVLGYLFALVLVAWALRPRSAAIVAPKGRPLVAGFELPDDRWYHQGHTWVAGAGTREVTVGLDAFAAKLVGSPMLVALPPVGQRVRQGAVGWHLAVDRTSIPMLAPVDGAIAEINQAVLADSRLAVTDPYGAGWLLKVRVDPSAVPEANLLSGRVARTWMEGVSERLRRTPTPEVGIAMPDGGVPVDGLARALGGADWARVAREYLLTGAAPRDGWDVPS